VAKLAMKTGRPVKILYTREEVFYAHRGRHPMKMDVTVALDGDGRIAAVDNKILIGRRRVRLVRLVTAYYAGQLLTVAYRFRDVPVRQLPDVHQQAACGPKRGHGSVQPRLRLRGGVGRAAESGADPIEVRRRNFIASSWRTVNGQKSPRTASSSAWSWWKRLGWKDLTAGSVGRGLACRVDVHHGTAIPSTRTRCRRAACW